MLCLPSRFAAVILSFAPLFFQRSWRHAEVLLVGAILAPGKRTVTSLLRVIGLARERHFVNYHRVLSRAAWSSRAASRRLLGHLIEAFAPSGPVVLGIDDIIERRRGKRIAAKGIYRDPVRSSHGHFVKASGLHWISLMLLAPVPWAGRVWALPFLTALAPSERYCRERGLRHKRLTDWARQLVLQARRWPPGRDIVVVGDSGFAALELLSALTQHEVTGITRLRLDAALYDPAPPRLPGTNGRPRTKGARLPNLSEVLRGTQTRWQRLVVRGWYGEGERDVEICSGTAVWRHGGMPIVPIRWCWSAILSIGSRRRPCCAPTLAARLSRSCFGSSSAGSSRSPSRKPVLTSASKPNDSGRIAPSPAPPQVCSRCSPSSPFWPPGSGRPNVMPWPVALGITSQVRPSATPSPSCDATSGENRVCSHHGATATCRNPAQHSSAPWPTPSATPPDGQSRAQ
jgi:hypothetical protein